MKTKLIAMFLTLASVLPAWAAPALIGHRGSLWGVENSREAFIAGAEMGYLYLETDVKVAGDGTFILIHDDTTDRLGGNLDITKATIDELKAETYTQTRSGETYTGKICTLEEYLQICKDYNVYPFIELKWATGINTNDCSNLSRMVDKVIEYGFGETAIINTSMKKCLEYIRERYPDFKLMFLCNSNWESNFDWCVEQNIGAYIQTGCFDKNTVTRFHEKDLKVGVWTLNTDALYKVYGNYGCDFIAVDYLDTVDLPELDPFSGLVPNVVDYPAYRGTVQESYTFEDAFVADVAFANVRRAVTGGSLLYVLDDVGVRAFDMKTCEKRADMNLTGIANVADLSVAADGTLMALADGSLYAWADLTAAPQLQMTLPDADNVSFCVSGSGDDLRVYYTTATGISGIALKKGSLPVRNLVELPENALLTVSPFSRDHVVVDTRATLPVEYAFNWETDGEAMKQFMATPAGNLWEGMAGFTPFRYGSNLYLFATGSESGPFGLYNVTSGLQSVEAVPDGIDGFENALTGYAGGFAWVEKGYIYLMAVAEGQGLLRCVFKGEEPKGNTGEVDFRFEKVWSFTDREGNAPEHIDGTNAQQGGAYKGYFYINDCSDKLIYVYGKDGLVGTLPGGAGWGTACDDAGNIIVRNDKQTALEHSVLIYPSGTMPGSGVEPLEVSFETLDIGQTNFISASGDVLGEGGYVYMFPNGQTVVNIIEFRNGEFVQTHRSGGLSIQSSTAGYVVPIKNNKEHWLYMVRNNGIYEYNGADEGVVLSGSSTRPPARNSTCGAEYFTLSSHNILVYNSGTNYTGGFTVKDQTDNKYIETVNPIGDKGYTAGGNYSVSNWIFAEKIDAGSYYLYQYCPANGIAVYRLWDANYVPESSVGEVAVAAGQRVYPNPAADKVNLAVPSSKVTVYTLAGVPVLQLTGERISSVQVGELSPGMYLMTTDSGAVRFLKK